MTLTPYLLRTALGVLSAVTVSGAGRPAKALEIPAKLVATTVAWQLHWDEKAGLTSGVPSVLTFRVNEESEAWVDGLRWIISFDDRDGDPFPYCLQRVSELPDEMKPIAPNRFGLAPRTTVTLPAYTHSFQKISTLTDRSAG